MGDFDTPDECITVTDQNVLVATAQNMEIVVSYEQTLVVQAFC